MKKKEKKVTPKDISKGATESCAEVTLNLQSVRSPHKGPRSLGRGLLQ